MKKIIRTNIIFIFLLILASVVFGEQNKPKEAEYRTFRGKQDILRVTYLDVWQGDATLIQTPSGKIILIDGGNGSNPYSRIDYGKRVIVPYLKLRGIKRIDIMIATHPHADHIGGLAYVLNNIPVDTVYDIGLDYPSPVYKAVLRAIDKNNVEYKILKAGDKLDFGEKTVVSVFNPQDEEITGGPNNNSIAFKMQYRNASFFFGGDIEASEGRIARMYGNKISSFFLKAPHHGSRTSIVPEFLDAINPAYVIISAGKNNSYGHPHPETIRAYERRNVVILRTDYDGNIDIKTDGLNYGIKKSKRRRASPYYPESSREYKRTVPRKSASRVSRRRKSVFRGKININTADAVELRKLPGVGRTIARRIVDYRETVGSFKTPSEIMKVRGIGRRTYENIRNNIVIKASD